MASGAGVGPGMVLKLSVLSQGHPGPGSPWPPDFGQLALRGGLPVSMVQPWSGDCVPAAEQNLTGALVRGEFRQEEGDRECKPLLCLLSLGRGGAILRGENQLILLLRKVLLILRRSGIIMSLGRIKGDTRGEITCYKADGYDKAGYQCDYPSKGRKRPP